jgi:phosphopantothenoylcysteine decarboxylase/phosphopantothenate--cysteine ligase
LKPNQLNGKQVLITAGPTYEKIDPVRFIGNFSTGKMGYALAEVLANLGAQVHLVSGPVQLSLHHPNVQVYAVESALEMYNACIQLFPQCQLAIMSAAVADYRPAQKANNKIKKQADTLQIDLIKNPDILAHLGATKTNAQVVVGFALETENEIENARKKLINKHADAIVLNSLRDEGAGFGSDNNKISIILPKGVIFEFPLKDKHSVAKDIIECIQDHLLHS